MALAGTGYKHRTLVSSVHFQHSLRGWNFQMTCSMYVVGVEGRKDPFFFRFTSGCQSNIAIKSAPIKGICKEFHDNVNTPFHQYGVKKKAFSFFFFLKKKPQSHSTVVSPDKQLITKVHEVVHNSFIIL